MIRKNDTIRIKPEWQDEGDDEIHWLAIEDEDGGRVKAIATNLGLSFPPVSVFHVYMLEGF